MKDDQCALAQGTNELMGLCSVPNDHCGRADYISISILNTTAGTGQDCAYSQTDIGPICCYGEHGVRTSGLCRHREGGGVGGGGDGGGGGRGGGGGDGGGAVPFLRAFMPFVYERHLLLWMCVEGEVATSIPGGPDGSGDMVICVVRALRTMSYSTFALMK